MNVNGLRIHPISGPEGLGAYVNELQRFARFGTTGGGVSRGGSSHRVWARIGWRFSSVGTSDQRSVSHFASEAFGRGAARPPPPPRLAVVLSREVVRPVPIRNIQVEPGRRCFPISCFVKLNREADSRLTNADRPATCEPIIVRRKVLPPGPVQSRVHPYQYPPSGWFVSLGQPADSSRRIGRACCSD